MRMAIAAVLFFIVGLFARKSMRDILEDVQYRRQEAERAAAKEEAARAKAEKASVEEDKLAGTRFDQKVGEEQRGEAFHPGRVADFIRQEMENG